MPAESERDPASAAQVEDPVWKDAPRIGDRRPVSEVEWAAVNLKRFREESGLTLQQAAAAAGMDMSYLHKIEAGTRPLPRVEKVHALCRAYGHRVDDLWVTSPPRAPFPVQRPRTLTYTSAPHFSPDHVAFVDLVFARLGAILDEKDPSARVQRLRDLAASAEALSLPAAPDPSVPRALPVESSEPVRRKKR